MLHEIILTKHKSSYIKGEINMTTEITKLWRLINFSSVLRRHELCSDELL